MKHHQFEADFDPSLHIIPLDPRNKIPAMMFGEKDEFDTLLAITDNGRISALPIDVDTVLVEEQRIVKSVSIADAILARINERFPNDKDIYGNPVSQYLAVGVVIGNKDQSSAKFIFEVWGFRERFGELDDLYDKLLSLGGTKVGDEHYAAIEKYISSESVGGWINQLIVFLKEQLNWSTYVRQALDETTPNKEDNKYAISFGGGDFKVGDQSDISLWCIDSDCQSCVIIIPPSTYQQIDSLVTKYAEKHNVAATIGCKRLDTDTPILMPVTMSIPSCESYFVPLSHFMQNHLPPPKQLALNLLHNIEFIEHDEYKQTIHLKRQAKRPKKGDYFTQDKESNRVEIYKTYVSEMAKPYSMKDMYMLRLKSLFRR